MLRDVNAIARYAPLVWLCKGFEQSSEQLPHQIVREELGDRANAGPLSGPSFAIEVARGLAHGSDGCRCAPNFASSSPTHCTEVRFAFIRPTMSMGVEVGGAVKNVMAIATGISDALELGLNARAALITRGLAEITRFGVALGARAETFTGLTGHRRSDSDGDR